MPKNNNDKPHGGAVELSSLLTKTRRAPAEATPLWDKLDVSRRGKVSQRTVAYWMKGGLPFLKLSARMVRFIPSDVEAFLRSRRIGGVK
jgi:hypothetical protein